MKLLGITGGIGMGKSTSAQVLKDRGIAVIDTDELAREVVARGSTALNEVVQAFGPDVLDAAGNLRRDELARRIFGDDRLRALLEGILHPRIRERWIEQTSLWRRENRPLAAVVIPLLYETNAQSHFDAVICVACSESAQKQRLLARGWTDSQIAQRQRAQWPTSKKMDSANYVVWTEGSLELHREQLSRILGS